jgi:hypothetical protein
MIWKTVERRDADYILGNILASDDVGPLGVSVMRSLFNVYQVEFSVERTVTFQHQFLPPTTLTALISCYTVSIPVTIILFYGKILKAKAVPLHATKALGGRGSIVPTHSRPRHYMGEWPASRPGRVLAPGKGPPVPIVQDAGWAPEPAWTQRLQEKPFASAGDRTSIARSSSP